MTTEKYPQINTEVKPSVEENAKQTNDMPTEELAQQKPAKSTHWPNEMPPQVSLELKLTEPFDMPTEKSHEEPTGKKMKVQAKFLSSEKMTAQQNSKLSLSCFLLLNISHYWSQYFSSISNYMVRI